jgi:hypothetical protein
MIGPNPQMLHMHADRTRRTAKTSSAGVADVAGEAELPEAANAHGLALSGRLSASVSGISG